MTTKELTKRIEELERRVRDLEMRPPMIQHQPIWITQPLPYPAQPYTPQFYPPWIVTSETVTGS